MKQFNQLLQTLGQSPHIDQGDLCVIIDSGVSKLSSYLNADSAGLWLLNNTATAFVCEVALFNGQEQKTAHENIITNENCPAIFDALDKLPKAMVEAFSVNDYFNNQKNYLKTLLNLTSIVLSPIIVSGQLQGFLYIGDSVNAIDWPQEVDFWCASLSNLIGRAQGRLQNHRYSNPPGHERG